MNFFARIILSAFLIPMLIPTFGFCQSDTAEPPLKFELTVDGKTQTIELDKEFELDLTGKTKFKLKASPHRQFEYAGLSFPYPRSLAYEAEHDPESQLWTLDGTDCVIMVFAFPNDDSIEHEELAEQIGAQFGRKTDYSETSLKCKGVSLVGTQIQAEVIGSKFMMNVFQIPTEGGTRFIVVQDNLEDDGTHSKDFQNVQTLLKTQFRILSPSMSYE